MDDSSLSDRIARYEGQIAAIVHRKYVHETHQRWAANHRRLPANGAKGQRTVDTKYRDLFGTRIHSVQCNESP